MWTWLLSFLSGPLLNNLVAAYKLKLQSDNTEDKIAADLAGRELLVQQREAELQTQYRIAELGKWYEPDKIMGYCVAFLLAKIVVWDTCLGLGTTNLHQGWMTGTANIIVMFYFGKRGFENIARIIKR